MTTPEFLVLSLLDGSFISIKGKTENKNSLSQVQNSLTFNIRLKPITILQFLSKIQTEGIPQLKYLLFLLSKKSLNTVPSHMKITQPLCIFKYLFSFHVAKLLS